MDAVINHIAKLISQQSDALDRWEKKHLRIQKTGIHALSHTHTHTTVCSSVRKFHSAVSVSFCQKGRFREKAREKNKPWIFVFSSQFGGDGRERWGGLDMMGVRGVSLWLLPLLPGVGSEAGEY